MVSKIGNYEEEETAHSPSCFLESIGQAKDTNAYYGGEDGGKGLALGGEVVGGIKKWGVFIWKAEDMGR